MEDKTERTIEELIDGVNDELAEMREQQIEEYGCLIPDTYDKPLGHDIVLNEDNMYPFPDHSERAVAVVSPSHRSYPAVLLPRGSGIAHSLQTDGMMMKHPVLEGTLVPIDLFDYDSGALANANYITYDNEEEMRSIWEDIEDEFPFDLVDVPALDGYGQSQEGIRWVKIDVDSVDIDAVSYSTYQESDEDPVYYPHYGWVEWAIENDSPIAIVYRNCD